MQGSRTSTFSSCGPFHASCGSFHASGGGCVVSLFSRTGSYPRWCCIQMPRSEQLLQRLEPPVAPGAFFCRSTSSSCSLIIDRGVIQEVQTHKQVDGVGARAQQGQIPASNCVCDHEHNAVHDVDLAHEVESGSVEIGQVSSEHAGDQNWHSLPCVCLRAVQPAKHRSDQWATTNSSWGRKNATESKSRAHFSSIEKSEQDEMQDSTC